ncbi:alpha/beta-hydrolase [Hyaloscypha variabilis]
MSFFKALSWLLTSSSLLVLAAASKTSLPLVDLGYEVHQASYNETGQYYNFTNIRYGAPSLGALRFSAPVAPFTVEPGIQDGGSTSVKCVSATPNWVLVGEEFLIEGLGAVDVDAGYQPPNLTTLPPPDEGISEDCLFLDVLTPEAVFNKAGEKGFAGAPVLVWIHGGGQVLGYKTIYGGGAGLLAASQVNGGEGIIYVAINYRLGLFGWLSGPTFQETGTANAGMLDQRLALEWIQNHIALFGGDPNRVTVMGESAGGASIMHQITAYGGTQGPAPFQQAILQSAAWLPMPIASTQEEIYDKFLKTAGVSTLNEARELSTEALQLVNYKMVGESPYGDFLFNPAVDGSFSPALPGKLLLSGGYDHNVKVLIGHNVNEGFALTTPYLPNNTAFTENIINLFFPAASPSVISLLENTFYPAPSDPTDVLGQINRARNLITESLFTCNANYLARAFEDAAYMYVFSVPPSWHAQDLTYTFFNGPDAGPVENATLALTMQAYFTNFAQTGNPNGAGVPAFPDYGTSGAYTQDLNLTFIGQIPDYLQNERCVWWQKGLYY